QQKRGSPSPTSACSPDALQDMDIVETFSSPTLNQKTVAIQLFHPLSKDKNVNILLFRCHIYDTAPPIPRQIKFFPHI
ncbi:hypothetical protein, partial [Sinorhizobium meliloti]|uniref:hypothetical protein n=1 Tax=Rhizobium meliloti TaxID=382 RepID=UPI001AECDB0B